MSVPSQTNLLRQQEIITELGQRAIVADNLDRLLQEASKTVIEAFDAEYSAIFELLPNRNEMRLKRGVGWDQEFSNTATISIDCDTHLENALGSKEPVIVTDRKEESCGSGSDVFTSHGVISGITATIGDTDNPWGVLGIYTTEKRKFTDHDTRFVQSVASLLSTAIEERTPRQLREEETLKSQIVEAVNDGVYVLDEDSRFAMVNEAYCEITGYSRDELLGSHATLIIDEEVLQQGSEMRTAMLKGQADNPTIEAELQTATGERVPVEGTFAMLPDADDSEYQRIGVVRDVSERKKRERALAESERRYRTLVENFPNGAVGLFDKDLRYTAVGGQLVRATNVAPEDRIGSSVHEIYPDDIVEEVEPYFHAALAGETNSFEVEFHDRHLLAHTLPIRDADDEVFAGMLVVQDVTDRKEYQQQLERSNARLESFASMLAHELRNPLQISQMYLQQVADGDECAFDEVDEALTRIEETIDILLMLSKGSEEVSTAETVDLASQAEEAWSTTATDGAELIVDATQTIRGKSSYLHHLFENLFRNAIEHAGDTVTVRVGDLDEVSTSSPERSSTGRSSGQRGGETASNETAQPSRSPREDEASGGSTDSSERSEDEARQGAKRTAGGFYVADDGPGIPADEREAVFKAGYSSDTNGTGLGLTLVAQLADAFGWEYTVTDSAAGGARFEFTNVETINGEEL